MPLLLALIVIAFFSILFYKEHRDEQERISFNLQVQREIQNFKIVHSKFTNDELLKRKNELSESYGVIVRSRAEKFAELIKKHEKNHDAYHALLSHNDSIKDYYLVKEFDSIYKTLQERKLLPDGYVPINVELDEQILSYIRPNIDWIQEQD